MAHTDSSMQGCNNFFANALQLPQSCTRPSILIDLISALERDFTSLLHAQHLVSHPVSAAIQSHLANPDPPKALVLSFHGPTGVGKNFVSDIIADNLFPGRGRSKFVHTIIGPHHLPHSLNQGAYSVSCHVMNALSSEQYVCYCVGDI